MKTRSALDLPQYPIGYATLFKSGWGFLSAYAKLTRISVGLLHELGCSLGRLHLRLQGGFSTVDVVCEAVRDHAPRRQRPVSQLHVRLGELVR
jgi:hypothetical protein